MQFNEFQRRLQDAHLSEQAMYLLSSMFETQVQIMKDFDSALEVLHKMADTIHGFVGLNEKTLMEIRRMQNRDSEHATVESVRNDPETEH